MEHTQAGWYELKDDSFGYDERFEGILSRTPDPRTLDTYADDAFDALVTLVDDIVNTYPYDKDSFGRIGVEQERAALASAGLDPFVIERTLNHIASVADSTKRLGRLIEQKLQPLEVVILPPDPVGESMQNIRHGNGDFEFPREKVEKLKALLLVLEKGLGIDIENDDMVTLSEGCLYSTMIRKTSYTIVQIEPLSRLVLSCDEIGNATFVLDTDTCRGLDLSPEDIAHLTKTVLKALLDYRPQLGTTITYSPKYMEMLAASLTEDFARGTKEGCEQDQAKLELLRPAATLAPDDYRTLKGIYKETGISDITLKKVATLLAGQLGELKTYKFGTVTTVGYSPNQQQMLVEHVRSTVPPDGYRSTYGIAEAFNSSKETIEAIIDTLADQLGEVREYGFGGKLLRGFSPEQQQQIYDCFFAVERAPDGFISTNRMANEIGMNPRTLHKILESMSDQLGEVQAYRSKRKTAEFLSPSQQQAILDYLSDVQAPEGYLPMNPLREKLGVSYDRLRNAIVELSADLDDIRDYRYGKLMTPCYSPAQQDKIAEYLKVSAIPPEGYLTLSGLSEQYDSDNRTVKKVLASLGDVIGEVEHYRFGNGTSLGYSPKQQRIILEHLKRTGN